MKQFLQSFVLSTGMVLAKHSNLTAADVPEKTYTLEDFNNNLFWNRPSQGKFLKSFDLIFLY